MAAILCKICRATPEVKGGNYHHGAMDSSFLIQTHKCVFNQELQVSSSSSTYKGKAYMLAVDEDPFSGSELNC